MNFHKEHNHDGNRYLFKYANILKLTILNPGLRIRIRSDQECFARIWNVLPGSGSGSGIIIPDPDPTNMKFNF